MIQTKFNSEIISSIEISTDTFHTQKKSIHVLNAKIYGQHRFGITIKSAVLWVNGVLNSRIVCHIYDLNYVTLLNIFHEIQYNIENKWKDTEWT